MARPTNEKQVKGAGVRVEFSNAYAGSTLPVASDYQSGTWVRIGGELSVTPNVEAAAKIKTSDTDTTVHTYTAGKDEPGTIQLSCKYTAAREDALRAIKKLDKSFRIVFADDSTGYGVQGYIESVAAKPDIENLITLDIVIQCSGPTVAISL